MKDEYIIINKTAIQKRIEEINKQIPEYKDEPYEMILRGEKDTLEEILSQSTPLIPEIEKAIDAPNMGEYQWSSDIKKDYILNLKLDI